MTLPVAQPNHESVSGSRWSPSRRCRRTLGGTRARPACVRPQTKEKSLDFISDFDGFVRLETISKI